MDVYVDSIHYLSLLVYLVAFIALTKFWYDVKEEKYWVGFPVTFFFLTLHEFFEILNDNFGYNVELFAEISEIIGAIVLTFSVFYLIKELRKINKIELSEPEE